MQAFSLVDPADADAAVAAARAPDSAFIAGGTDVMQLMKDGVSSWRRLVDLDALPMDGIGTGPEGLRIGALARMSDVAAHPEVRQNWPAVSQALLASASPQLRNMATMGGNLLQRTRCGYFRDTGFACNKRAPGSGCPAIRGENRLLAILGTSDHCIATHASDLAVALVALDAVLELRGADGAQRRMPLAELHRLPGDAPHEETTLLPGELIIAIAVPAGPAARGSTYLKVRDRASFEFALVSAAVGLDVRDGAVRDARVAMGGVGTKPWRMPQVEAALRGRPAADATFRDAAALAAEGARPATRNGFKQVLMQRALVRALQTAAA